MGSGSSGGGGSSGKVEYPAYMQTCHGLWLNSAGADTISTSVTASMNAALGNSPFTGLLAYDPDTDLAVAEALITALTVLSPTTMLSDALTQFAAVAASEDTIYSAVTVGSRIDAVKTAYSDMVDDEISVKVLPKFRRGMQDINAVQNSSFVIGEALIYAEKTRSVAKFAADIELRAYDKRGDMVVQLVGEQIKFMSARLDFSKTAAHYSTEFARIKVIAKKEESEANIELSEKDAEWDLRVYQYGSNVMASIAGAAATVNKKPNSLMSALGGALSGLASGAMMGTAIGGPGIGTGIGALFGGLLGGLGGMFG